MACLNKALDNWQKQLAEITASEPAHLSCYQLTIEPGTVFYTPKKGAELTADSDRVADLYLLTEEFLQEKGLPLMKCPIMQGRGRPRAII